MIDDEKFKAHYLTLCKEVEKLKNEARNDQDTRRLAMELQGMFLALKGEMEAWNKKIERDVEILKQAYPEAVELEDAMHDDLKKKLENMTEPEENPKIKEKMPENFLI